MPSPDAPAAALSATERLETMLAERSSLHVSPESFASLLLVAAKALEEIKVASITRGPFIALDALDTIKERLDELLGRSE